MADNGNRGPNDFRARNGRRRREPPIIDASATEVPLAADEAAAPADNPDAEHLPVTEPGASEAAAPDVAEPVLFGGARRDPAVKAEGETPSTPSEPAAPVDVEPIAPEPVATAARAEQPSVSPSAAYSGSARAAVPPPPAAAPAAGGGGAAPWLLGICSLALAAALAWVLYTEPQRSGRDQIDELRNQVAALQARPDPAQIQGRVAALDKRVSDLTTRLDAVAEAPKPTAEPAPSGDAAPATVAAVGALAAKVDGLDGRLGSLASAQDRTEKAVAGLPKPVAPDFAPVNARIADLDGRINAIEGKLNAGGARLNGVDAKLNGFDSKINGVDSRMNGFENRTNGIEAKANQTAAGLGTLQATIANLPRIDLGPLQATTNALDGRVAKIEGQLAAPKNGERVTEARAVGSADETRATPIAVVAQAVVRAIAEGRPYASDLDALKALGADPQTLAKLSPLAAQGSPTAAALRQRWQEVEGDVLAAVKPVEGGSAFDRLAASARNLVQVRRVGAVQGDDPAALVSQVDAALDAGDVPAALSAWSKLPAAGQDKSRDWADAARSRVDADGAAQGLVSNAIATLGKNKI